MKRIFLLLFLILFCTSSVLADELDDMNSLWSNYNDVDIDNLKPVTDKEFEQALESKTGKKKKNKDIPKGNNLQQGNESEYLMNIPADPAILLTPVTLSYGKYEIPVGHYQIIGEKNDGKAVIKLYQAHDLVALLPAVETNDDFNQDSINFAKLVDYKDNQARIIFGSLDFNAYVILNVIE